MPNDFSLREQLKNACVKSKDLSLIHELFRTHRFDAAVATDQLNEYLDLRDEPIIVHCLLTYGANPNIVPMREIETIEDLKILAEYGYDVRSNGHIMLQSDSSNFVPVIRPTANSLSRDYVHDPEALEWLLDNGVNINLTDTARTSFGNPLYRGASDWSLHILDNVAANGDIQQFDYLVSRGAKPTKSLALHFASKCPDPDLSVAMVSRLLDHHGMDIHADTDDLRNYFHHSPDSGTPLNCAIYHKNIAVIEELLRRGVDVNNSGRSGIWPVYPAIGGGPFHTKGFIPALKPLLMAGADPSRALLCAVRVRRLEAIGICLQCGADPDTALQEARRLEDERLKYEAESEFVTEEQARESKEQFESFMAGLHQLLRQERRES